MNPCEKPYSPPGGISIIPENQGHLFDLNYKCISCGEVWEEKRIEHARLFEEHNLAKARNLYQAEVQSVALSIFMGLLTKETVESMRSDHHSQTMANHIDAALTGAIHFVSELKKLKPSDYYYEQWKKLYANPQDQYVTVGESPYMRNPHG